MVKINLKKGEEIIRQIPIEQITTDAHQPRKNIGDLDGLKKSIKKYGILQPLRLSKFDEKQYMIVFGERRFQAAKELGLKTLPCIIQKENKTKKDLFIQITENIQRLDLTGLELAQTYKRACDGLGISQKELAEELGAAPSTISKTLNINKLPEVILKELEVLPRENQPSITVLSELARKKEEEQMRVWEKVRQGGLLTMTDLEKLKIKGRGRPKGRITDEFDVDSLTDGIKRLFKTKEGKEKVIRTLGRKRLKKIIEIIKEMEKKTNPKGKK